MTDILLTFSFFFFNIYVFIYLVAPGLSCGMWTLSCGMHVGSNSLTRDRTQGPCIESVESYPLCHQENPSWPFLRVVLERGWERAQNTKRKNIRKRRTRMGAFSSFLVPNFAGPSLAREQHLPLGMRWSKWPAQKICPQGWGRSFGSAHWAPRNLSKAQARSSGLELRRWPRAHSSLWWALTAWHAAVRHIDNYLLNAWMNANSHHILPPLVGARGVKEKTPRWEARLSGSSPQSSEWPWASGWSSWETQFALLLNEMAWWSTDFIKSPSSSHTQSLFQFTPQIHVLRQVTLPCLSRKGRSPLPYSWNPGWSYDLLSQ